MRTVRYSIIESDLAENLLKKLSDMTLLNPYEVGLYLMRQK